METNASKSIRQRINELTESRAVLALISVIGFILIWEAIAYQLPPHEFPTLFELFDAMVEVYSGEATHKPADHIPITLQRIFLAFIFALLVGIPIGILMGINTIVEDFGGVYVMAALAFPSIVWAFLLTLWFGLTDYLVPVLATFFVATPYVIINLWKGMNDLDQNLVTMADSFGVGRWLRWRYVFIPHLFSFILPIMRVTLAISWKVMLIAEIFGSGNGIGNVVESAFITQDNHIILAWAIPIMFLMFLLEKLLHLAETRLFEWRPEVDTSLERR